MADVLCRQEMENSREGLMELMGLMMADSEREGAVIVGQIVGACEISSGKYGVVELAFHVVGRFPGYFYQHIGAIL